MDAWSSVLALIALSSVVALIKEVARIDRDWGVSLVLLGAAVAAGAVFARRQVCLPHPLLDFGLFRSRGLSAGVVAAAVGLFAVAGTQLVITQRFQLVEGFTPLQAGGLVACVALGGIPTSLIAGESLRNNLGYRHAGAIVRLPEQNPKSFLALRRHQC